MILVYVSVWEDNCIKTHVYVKLQTYVSDILGKTLCNILFIPNITTFIKKSHKSGKPDPSTCHSLSTKVHDINNLGCLSKFS